MNVPEQAVATRRRAGARRRRPWLLFPAGGLLWVATYEISLWATAVLCAAAFVLITYAMPHLTEDDQPAELPIESRSQR